MFFEALLISLPLLLGQTSTGTANNSSREVIPAPLTQQQKTNKVSPKTGLRKKSTEDQDQAVRILHEVLNQASSVPDTEQRSLIVSNAAELLWKYDEQRARSEFSSIIDVLLDQYKAELKSQEQDASKREKLNAALNMVVKALARRNPRSADLTLKRYYKLREELLSEDKSGPQYSEERLEVAQDSLDLDTKQSAAIAASILNTSLPLAFPQYLNQLRGRDPTLADTLFQKAVTMLSTGVYSAREVIDLSSYTFKEPLTFVPVPAPSEGDGDALEFSAISSQLSPPEDGPGSGLASAYMRAASAYLGSQLQQGSPKTKDPVFLGQSFFLARKLGIYAANSGLDATGAWQRLNSYIESLALAAGIRSASLQNLATYAERLATGSQVFHFGDGSSSLEEAKAAKDKKRKTQLTLRGIWGLIQSQKFGEAEQQAKDLEGDIDKGRVMDLINVYAGKAAVKEHDWDEVLRRVAGINDAQIRLLLQLEAARAAGSLKGDARDVAFRLLSDARSVIYKVEGTNRVKGAAAIASVFSSVEPHAVEEILAEAVTAINSSGVYETDNYQVKVSLLPDFNLMLVLPGSDYETSFRRVAEIDWESTFKSINLIAAKVPQAMAQIAACRVILKS